MNHNATRRIGWIINTMRSAAGKREAPINKIPVLIKNDPFRSLVFTILSARTRDENSLTAGAAILEKAPNAKTLAAMPVKKIEKLDQPSGFYRVKARHLKQMAAMLLHDFHGKVPNDMESLLRLPGVGRKTANILLAYSFGKDAIPVDTHVHRISNRLGIVKTRSPEKTEKALEIVVPRRFWRTLNHAFVSYGQTICLPRNPKCRECMLKRICWRVGVKSSLQ